MAVRMVSVTVVPLSFDSMPTRACSSSSSRTARVFMTLSSSFLRGFFRTTRVSRSATSSGWCDRRRLRAFTLRSQAPDEGHEASMDGEHVDASIWCRLDVDVAAEFCVAGVASTACGTCNTTTKDAWVRLNVAFTTSSSSGTVAAYVLNTQTPTAGTQFYVDSVMFTEGSTLSNFGDGNTASWVWNGAANNSTSTGPAP